jgi:hypothetical protein
LPPQENNFHKLFIHELCNFLSDLTGKIPEKYLEVLYLINSRINDSVDGIPQSFQPEVLDRILIGEFCKNKKICEKLILTVENQIKQKIPFKIDLLCEYVINDEMQVFSE